MTDIYPHITISKVLLMFCRLLSIYEHIQHLFVNLRNLAFKRIIAIVEVSTSLKFLYNYYIII